MGLLSPDHLRLAKQIIRRAAEVGLDEAGTRLAGSAWPAVKKILAPVVGELDRRFPALMLADKDAAAKAADQAVQALDQDRALQEMLGASFAQLTVGQQAILDQLASNGAKLDDIGAAVTRGAGDLASIQAQLQKLQLSFDLSRASDDPSAGLTLDQVLRRLDAANNSAFAQLDADDADGAAATLAEARELAESALRRWASDADVAVALGYIEKTQSEVDRADHPDRSLAALSKAATYFAQGTASSSPSAQLGGLNGMANVYMLHGDYDVALQIGDLLFRTAPYYGFAIYDYALALEAKRGRDGDDAALLRTLADVYASLLKTMADPAQRFAASQYAYVAGKARAVDEALASG